MKVFEQFHAVPLLAACVFLFTKQAFKLSLKYFQKIIKQLLKSVLVGYEKLLRPRFVLSLCAIYNTNLCLNNSSHPARPHSIIVYQLPVHILYYFPLIFSLTVVHCRRFFPSGSVIPKAGLMQTQV